MRRREDRNFDRQLIGLSGPEVDVRELPLVHVTAAWNSKEILRSSKLLTRRCKVFKKDLIYFFVLRPAYRTKIGDEDSHQISRFPVAFVFKSTAVPDPLHVYPFDTGGAADGSFDSQADPYVPLEDYALEPNYKSILTFISWAFGKVSDYYSGRTRHGLSDAIKPFQSVAVSYLDIARLGSEGSNEHDMRASTIEVAASHNVEISGNLHLIIAPKQFVEGNKPVMDLVDPLIGAGANLKLYDWQPNRSPNEYQMDIQRIAEDWYNKAGLL